jgi:rod shape-determining protein MreC
LKQYLKKKGTKIGAIVLAVALLTVIVTGATGGRAGFFGNLSGALRRPVQNVVGAVADWLEGIYGYMYKYDDLQAENESLRTQLAQAQEEARAGADAQEENERLRNLLKFTEKHSDMELESAKVVARTASNWSSTFTISKGENDGVALGDPVITEFGALTGTVTELGGDWAVVSTVIDASTSIGSIASESGATGMIIGDAADMQKGLTKLTYLPSDSQIFTGDTVLTSGVGGSYPEGLVIGTISSVQTEAGGQVEYGLVKPYCDLNALVQVFVVKSYDVVK